ncbi:Pvc16 family protein [Candidatus Uabimicrobium sp. HlEnr_7]|uniref:Pvc16 family protein n=1 Tax=Candidatus Uabimicrobium helgolandensis TaxID=3095367 RepID=UPI003556B54B
MNDSALRKVNQKLKDVIEQRLKIDVKFKFPPERSREGSVAIVPYKMVKNEHLSNTLPAVDRVLSPLFFDLHYLIAPNAGTIELELEILGRIARLFHDQPSFTIGNEKIKVIYQDLNLEEWTHIWRLNNDNIKLCASYLVSPVSIESQVVSEYTTPIKKISLRSKRLAPLDFLFRFDKKLEQDLQHNINLSSDLVKEFKDNGHSAFSEWRVIHNEQERYWQIIEIVETIEKQKVQIHYYIFPGIYYQDTEGKYYQDESKRENVLEVYRETIEKYREDLIEPLKEDLKKHKYYVLKVQDQNGNEIIEVMEKPENQLQLQFLK